MTGVSSTRSISRNEFWLVKTLSLLRSPRSKLVWFVAALAHPSAAHATHRRDALRVS
jgi:hypothetical protein